MTQGAPLGLEYDVAHLLGGLVLVLSFILLSQRRTLAVIRVAAAQAWVLAAAAAWQAITQEEGGHLWLAALIAGGFKGALVPLALLHILRRIGASRSVETALGIGPSLAIGVGLVALSILVVIPVTTGEAALTREGLSLALSVVLLGLLTMITRRNAITQLVGFMALENGLILAGIGVNGMPLLVELGVAFGVLVAFLVFGMFILRIRERFDSVDLGELETAHGEADDAVQPAGRSA